MVPDGIPKEPRRGGDARIGAGRTSFLATQDPPALASAAIVVAVLLILAGALVLGLASESSADAWKTKVKIIGLGSGTIGPLGFSTGSAPFLGLALVVALALVDRGAGGRSGPLLPLVTAGAVASAGWLLLFTFLGVVVDLTALADDAVSLTGVLLIDVGALLILAASLLWALRLLQAVRSRSG